MSSVTGTIKSHATYRGRFAPSPTGPLHLGSLYAAVAGYLRARSLNGQWLLRIEDVDKPRCVEGADSQIMRDLEAFGLVWDEEVLWQSRRHEAYAAALDQLQKASLAYPCACSRKQIEAYNLRHGINTHIYPGICRAGLHGRSGRAWRLNTQGVEIRFTDLLQGQFHETLEQSCGDFILYRADGLWAYQMAVVVDDEEQGISEVVRGVDLLDSTARQIYLQRVLEYQQPDYLHLPIIVDEAMRKLSKSTFAPAISPQDRISLLISIFQLLGLPTDNTLNDANISELWSWAISHWNLGNLPKTRYIQQPDTSDILLKTR